MTTNVPLLPGRTSSETSSSTAASELTLHDEQPLATTSLTDSSSEWRKYFETQLVVSTSSTRTHVSGQHHVYLTPPSDLKKGPLFICLHGAGSSGMSFGRFAKAVKTTAPEAGVLAIDFRGHGSLVAAPSATAPSINTVTATTTDYSLDALTADIRDILDALLSHLSWPSLPPSVLIGHSLGGAVATRLLSTRDPAPRREIMGLMVLDVVEGSAIEALAHMKTYLRSRPESFASVDEAVQWHIRSRTIRDAHSAAASVPRLLVEGPESRFVWRTDLAGTEPWWEGWFTGMSKGFLESRVAKALVLAGTDRLDRELLVGQMQGERGGMHDVKQGLILPGRFQLEVLPEAGHFIQEDVPDKMAGLAVEFFRRNDRSAMVLPPKVSDLLAQGKKV